jgi:hypothetical protein
MMMESDSGPGDHRYNPRTAAPALKTAIAELAQQASRPLPDFDGISLGAAYELAVETYGDQLPRYWRVWHSWNVASADPPADMGDL